MNEVLMKRLKSELLMTKVELQQRLLQEKIDALNTEFAIDWEGNAWEDDKKKYFIHTIQDDLQDVERALEKMEQGSYGICEKTGEEIPYHLLETIPTARTIYDVYYVWV